MALDFVWLAARSGLRFAWELRWLSLLSLASLLVTPNISACVSPRSAIEQVTPKQSDPQQRSRRCTGAAEMITDLAAARSLSLLGGTAGQGSGGQDENICGGSLPFVLARKQHREPPAYAVGGIDRIGELASRLLASWLDGQ